MPGQTRRPVISTSSMTPTTTVRTGASGCPKRSRAAAALLKHQYLVAHAGLGPVHGHGEARRRTG